MTSKICKSCGLSFDGGSAAKRCLECRAKHIKEKQKADYRIRSEAVGRKAMERIENCAICKKPFPVKGPTQVRCEACTKEVYLQKNKELYLKRKNKKADQYCKVCKKQLTIYQSVYCSIKCLSARKRSDKENDIATSKLNEYVKAVHPEEFPTAKGWTLRAPDGAEYTCINLANFFREHAHLLDASPEEAALGMYIVKTSLLGNRPEKHRMYDWHGWRLLGWNDHPFTRSDSEDDE